MSPIHKHFKAMPELYSQGSICRAGYIQRKCFISIQSLFDLVREGIADLAVVSKVNPVTDDIVYEVL